KRRGDEETMARHGAADVSKVHVKDVLLTVRPKSLLTQQIRPRSQEWYPAESRPLLKFAHIGKWKVQDVLAVHLHLVGAIADAGGHGNFHTVRRVRETD